MSLRKETNYFSFFDFFGCRSHRVLGPPRCNRNTARQAKDRMQNRILIIFLVDNKTNPPRTSELKHDRVDEGNVIG